MELGHSSPIKLDLTSVRLQSIKTAYPQVSYETPQPDGQEKELKSRLWKTEDQFTEQDNGKCGHEAKNRHSSGYISRSPTITGTDLPGAAEYYFQVPHFDRIACGLPLQAHIGL